ncbi:MAG: zinc ribbon domain-containing protein [Kiritimatiellae bacterium]|nr:zinc ribbon domain-containing protein [Kiritimatiellia bacterium]
MPLHEYDCSKCGQTVEILIRRAGAPAECPHCGSQALKRRLSTFAPGKARSDANRGCDTCPSAAGAGCPSGFCGRN